MVPIREAASLEGLIVLGVIYFVLNILQKAGQKQGRTTVPPKPQTETTATQEEGVSLDSILKEIERLKQQKQNPAPVSRPAPPPAPRPVPAQPRARPTAQPRQAPARPARLPARDAERGPLGRHSKTALPSAEEVEDRTGSERGIRPVTERPGPVRGERTVVDRDESAEEVVQRRIAEAEARNRPLNAQDHRRFDAQVRATAVEPIHRDKDITRLRQAFIWAEILGPPKALEE